MPTTGGVFIMLLYSLLSRLPYAVAISGFLTFSASNLVSTVSGSYYTDGPVRTYRPYYTVLGRVVTMMRVCVSSETAATSGAQVNANRL